MLEIQQTLHAFRCPQVHAVLMLVCKLISNRKINKQIILTFSLRIAYSVQFTANVGTRMVLERTLKSDSVIYLFLFSPFCGCTRCHCWHSVLSCLHCGSSWQHPGSRARGGRGGQCGTSTRAEPSKVMSTRIFFSFFHLFFHGDTESANQSINQVHK